MGVSVDFQNNEIPPWYALSGGVAGTVAAMIDIFLDTSKLFGENL